MAYSVTCISMEEVCRILVTTKEQIILIVEEGIVAPLDTSSVEWEFEERKVLMIKKACRLQRELSLNWHAVAIVLQMMDEREVLLMENQRLQSQLERFMLS